MRGLCAAALLLGLAGQLGALDPTTELLTAPRVRRDVRILLPNGDALPRVELDENGMVYEEPLSIASSGELAFAVANYNPLEMEVKSESAESEDPNYAQLEKFVKAFVGTFEKVAGVAPVADVRTEGFDQAGCPAAAQAAEALVRFDGHVRSGRLEASEVDEWARGATGRRGMARVAKTISKRVAGLETAASDAKETLAEIKRLRDRLKSDDAPCSLQVLAGLTIFFRTEPQTDVEHIASLASAAKDLAQSLAAAADDNDRWYPPASRNAQGNATSRDYVFRRQAARPDKVVTITVSMRRFELKARADSLDHVEVPESARQLQFRLRQYSRFVPELGAGLVVASIKTPTYGVVEDAAGKTVVAKTAVEPRDFKGALLLNAVCRCWGPGFLHPMLQFGLAADDSTPAVLAGVGFRFTRPRGLGISAGGVLAWVKDLDQLAIGGPVKDQAQIDADLKAQTTVRPYFAVQFTF